MQTSEHKLEQQVEEIAQLAKENKNIDAAALMMSVLDSHQRNLLPVSQKRLGYFVSLAAPPLGLLFALKFYYSDYDDARHAAYTCVVLTVVSLLLFWLFVKVLFSGSTVTPEQIEQIKPSDIMQLTQ